MISITTKLIPVKTLRRSGLKREGTIFLVIHDTGNDGSTALQNVNYYIKSASEMEASAHTFIDDISIIQCIPLDEKAWHVRRSVQTDNALFGVDANDYSIGVELCYSSKGLMKNMVAYQNLVDYVRMLCREYKINPATHIKGHFQLDPERRTDPINAFKHINKTWEMFLKDVSVSVPTPATVSPTKAEQKAVIYKLLDDVRSKIELL